MFSIKEAKEWVRDIRVLIVEDEEIFCQTLALEFQRKGFLVSTASNGQEALDFLQKTHVDIIISDILMPNCTGIELLDRVRKENPNLPLVLLMTGYAEISSMDASQKGAEAIFSKPFNRKALVEAVFRLVIPTKIESRPNHAYPHVSVHFENGSSISKASILNFYGNSLFVALENYFPQICDTVKLDIFFSATEKPLSLAGTVKWLSFKPLINQPPGMGIELFNVNDEYRHKIENLIQP
jgi:CheY-like chemotaxis protein